MIRVTIEQYAYTAHSFRWQATVETPKKTERGTDFLTYEEASKWAKAVIE